MANSLIERARVGDVGAEGDRTVCGCVPLPPPLAPGEVLLSDITGAGGRDGPSVELGRGSRYETGGGAGACGEGVGMSEEGYPGAAGKVALVGALSIGRALLAALPADNGDGASQGAGTLYRPGEQGLACGWIAWISPSGKAHQHSTTSSCIT